MERIEQEYEREGMKREERRREKKEGKGRKMREQGIEIWIKLGKEEEKERRGE